MDEYSIIGGDGNEYGPVTADEIRNWVKQGRANAQTQTIKNGGEPKPMGSYAEFAMLFGGALGAGAASTQGASGGLRLSPQPPTASAVSTLPGMPPGQTSSNTDTRGIIISLIDPIVRAAGWMKLIAVVSFIGGIFSALSIWGIIFAWIPIWQGILLWKAANAAKAAQIDGSELNAESSLSNLKTYFTLMGVLMLLYIIFFVGMIIMVFVLGGAGILDAMEQGY